MIDNKRQKRDHQVRGRATQGCRITPSGRNRTSDQLISEHTDTQPTTLQSIALPTELHSVRYMRHPKRIYKALHAPTHPFTSSTLQETPKHTCCTSSSPFLRTETHQTRHSNQWTRTHHTSLRNNREMDPVMAASSVLAGRPSAYTSANYGARNEEDCKYPRGLTSHRRAFSNMPRLSVP